MKVEPHQERAFSELDALKAHIEDIDLIASRNGYRISLVDNRLSLDEKRIADVETHGVNVDAKLAELRGLILNIRHRTLYGACAWEAARTELSRL